MSSAADISFHVSIYIFHQSWMIVQNNRFNRLGLIFLQLVLWMKCVETIVVSCLQTANLRNIPQVRDVNAILCFVNSRLKMLKLLQIFTNLHETRWVSSLDQCLQNMYWDFWLSLAFTRWKSGNVPAFHCQNIVASSTVFENHTDSMQEPDGVVIR